MAATGTSNETPTETARAPAFSGFKPSLRKFLRELAAGNSREWFDENRQRFETDVREPVRAFIRAAEPRLHAISPHLFVDDRRARGSMMRMNRDTRFSADKRPYHESVIMRFHNDHEDPAWAPSYTMRITPRAFVLGAGMRVPGPRTLANLREHIDERREDWSAVRDDPAFVAFFGGFPEPQLKRVPRPFDPEHPFADDLRRRDFRTYRSLRVGVAAAPEFLDEVEATFMAAEPLMEFLCQVVGIPWRE